MQRLKLTWLANEGTIAQTAPTFRILLGITIGMQTLPRILLWFGAEFFTDQSGEPTNMYFALMLVLYVLVLSYVVFFITVVCKTRRHIRNRYGIPEQSCHGCEDCCCAYWCMCCTVSQMARHTADYETYAGLCCSETGLPGHTPSIV